MFQWQFFLWKERFEAKTILFHSVNLAIVTILNSRTSKSERVMSLVRPINQNQLVPHWLLVLQYV